MTFFSSKYVIKKVKENQNWPLVEFQEKDDPNVNYVCNVYVQHITETSNRYGIAS